MTLVIICSNMEASSEERTNYRKIDKAILEKIINKTGLRTGLALVGLGLLLISTASQVTKVIGYSFLLLTGGLMLLNIRPRW